MKRLLILLLSALLLCGCGQELQPTEDSLLPSETDAPSQSSDAPGYYAPNSTMEEQTNGAVKVYPLNGENCHGLIPMGNDLLVFSGIETTTLTKLSGNDLHPTALSTLDCAIYAEDGAVTAGDKGVTYFDSYRSELVFLDTNLREVSRVSLGDALQGFPALSADRQRLYYCTDDALRVFELETGLHKLLKEMDYESQSVVKLHCDGTVIECGVFDGERWNNLFISAENGETLQQFGEDIALATGNDSYFALVAQGNANEFLAGTVGEEPRQLYLRDLTAIPYPILDLGGAMLVTYAPNSTSVYLDYYDLMTGKRTARLELPGGASPWSAFGRPEENCIYMLRYDEQFGRDCIYRWDPAMSPLVDYTEYLTFRYTEEYPDFEGLAECQERADALSQHYDVDIRIWTDATEIQPWDYTLIPEYRVPVILDRLDDLERALSWYPDRFLERAAIGTSDGKLRICLVASISGQLGAGSVETAHGLQFWDEEEHSYICLTSSQSIEQNLYHELCHVIDSRVLSLCNLYDDWEDLNPEGFEYDYDYEKNLERRDFDLLEGENRAFIDLYSMSFPKEDRARIMEYAMMDGNQEYFESSIMQKKLSTLCRGIRKAFKLQKAPEIFRWEQYLQEPLAP